MRGLAILAAALPLAACMRPVPARAPLALANLKDASTRYAALMSGPAVEIPLDTLAALRESRVLVVRGFLTDLWRVRVMADQIAELERLGVDCVRVERGFDSEAAPRRNALAIAEAIEASPKPVILLTHSKGSVDSLVALVERPELCACVRGWISLDAPMQGSPVADYAAARRSRRAAIGWALGLILSGDAETLDELTTARRVDYLAERAGEIDAVARQVKIVCYGSVIDPKSSALALATHRLLRAEPRNDGLVPVERTALPRATVVRDPAGPSHRGATMAIAAPNFDRKRQLRALLAILAEAPPA